jgi:AraC-like DNA-binding protein
MALCAAAISIGSDVFGKPGAVIAFIAYLVFLFGVIGLWGAAGDWRVLRLLRQGRLQLEGKVTAGDRVVVSGELQVDGDPLVAPFSQQPCAAYTYQVTGSRRRASGEGVRKYQQLALQGFAMQPIHVDGDGMRLSFMALPEAEPELTESKLGGEWGERARAWLNAHPGGDHGLADIARAVGTSPWHLARIFREECGVTLHRYRQRQRLGIAIERLTSGAEDLSALAHDLGYSSHSHFSREFRRHVGVAPSSLRSGR